jgi:glucan exporter ATP-binding protein
MSQLITAQYPVLTWWGILNVLQRAAATTALVAVFTLGALLVRRGEMTVGEIVSFVAFANLLIGKLDQVSSFVTSVFRQGPVLRSYFALLDEQNAIAEPADAKPLGTVAGDVKFENVSFTFPESQQGVFNLDIAAAPGKTVALVGPTGSGKSTFVKLVQRLYDVQGGRILIDGQDVSKVAQGSLRRAIAVVPQDPVLFHRTIAENIGYGRPDASREEIALAARRARAHDFIMSLPKGYDTLVGERGVKLSGGERQRVAIARAFLADAPILVLDEATSSLDVETEHHVQAAMDALMAGRTTIVIAHRLSTVRSADRILVFDKGRIIEEGRHAELVEAGGAYARLHATAAGTA